MIELRDASRASYAWRNGARTISQAQPQALDEKGRAAWWWLAERAMVKALAAAEFVFTDTFATRVANDCGQGIRCRDGA